MTLSELIIEYRKKNNLSQRKFAEKCDLSNGYISMLENGINPKTNLPITPTIPQLIKLSNGLNMTLAQLFSIIDDIDVSLDPQCDETYDKHLLKNIFYLSPDPSPETQTLLVFNKNGIPGAHEVELPSDDVLNEINKLVNALRPYPAKQINALLKIVENGGNIPLNPNLPPELKELVSIAVNLSEDSIKALIQVAKTMK